MGRAGLRELGMKGLIFGEYDPMNSHNSLNPLDLIFQISKNHVWPFPAHTLGAWCYAGPKGVASDATKTLAFDVRGLGAFTDQVIYMGLIGRVGA